MVRLLWVLGLIGFVAVPAAGGGVYKWTDKDGKTHFGDQPPADARAEALRIQTYTGPAEVVEASDKTARGVTLFTAAWCGVCKQAKDYFSKKGVAYTEYDVEKSPTGKAEFKRLQGKGVPIILVGSRRMNGFSPDRLDQMLRDTGN